MTRPIAIVGAGIAGASLAAELAPHAEVVLFEAEEQPGRHATGRSAAFWSETYGGPKVQPLTSASFAMLDTPPRAFSEHGFLRRTGALHIADEEGMEALEKLGREFEDSAVSLEMLDGDALRALVPGLDARWRQGLLEPSCADIDVGGLHQAYLRAARRAGVRLVTGVRIESAEPTADGWRLGWRGGELELGVLVNAAGAWADGLAEHAGVRPIGIRPHRRTVLQIESDPPPPADLPLVIDARGRFYFKAEAGRRLWLSPHDETPEPPADTAPHEIDVARAIDRFERAVDWKVARLERKWAGQRSFAPDRLPVYGFDPGQPRFFWCAGQGGFGIQTAPAAAKLCVALMLGQDDRTLEGIDPALYSPARFA